jgi:hypothetical protein
MLYAILYAAGWKHKETTEEENTGYVFFKLLSTDQLGNRAGERGEALPMRPTARGLVQHGIPPGWLVENGPARCVVVCDERSMPPALADQSTFWG